jgi:hypothetical protein
VPLGVQKLVSQGAEKLVSSGAERNVAPSPDVAERGRQRRSVLPSPVTRCRDDKISASRRVSAGTKVPRVGRFRYAERGFARIRLEAGVTR